MQPCTITIKNYRCFPDRNPCRLELDRGFTSFVGVNNVGKSTLLRFFFELRNLLQRAAPNQELMSAYRQNTAFSYPGTITDIEEVFYRGNDRPIEVQIDLPGPAATTTKPNRLQLLVPRSTNTFSAALFVDGNRLFPEHVAFELLDLQDFTDILTALSNTLYIGPFRNAINIGSQQSYFDIQIGQSFIATWREWKTGVNRRNNEAAHKLTDDVRRIFGFRQLEINAAEEDRALQLLVDGRSYRLPELGAGVAQFIIVLANVAVRQPAYVLIDEPELNLHPSLQLDFLTTLGSYATEGVLFATHSLGLARAASDRIYAVQREALPDGETVARVEPFETTPRLAELVGELSFSGQSSLGFSKILLVEGPTEVKTMQQFLRAYRKDHQTVLLPLWGGNMIKGGMQDQLLEVKRITTDVLALIDSERQAAGAPLDAERAAFVQDCAEVGITCTVLNRRAIENYFSAPAIQHALDAAFSALGPYEALKTAATPWPKRDNWRIARAMNSTDLQGTDLGQFLESL